MLKRLSLTFALFAIASSSWAGACRGITIDDELLACLGKQSLALAKKSNPEFEKAKNSIPKPSNTTPVRMVTCMKGTDYCFISARFDQIFMCEHYKKVAEMLCDSVTTPDKMICTKPEKEPLSPVTYCVE